VSKMRVTPKRREKKREVYLKKGGDRGHAGAARRRRDGGMDFAEGFAQVMLQAPERPLRSAWLRRRVLALTKTREGHRDISTSRSELDGVGQEVAQHLEYKQGGGEGSFGRSECAAISPEQQKMPSLQASNLRPYLGDLGAVHEDLHVLGPGRLAILKRMRTTRGVCQGPGQ